MNDIHLNDTLKKGALSNKTTWIDLITSPISFFILSILRSKNTHSIEALNQAIPRKYKNLLNNLINALEDRGHVELRGDELKVLNHEHINNSSLEDLLLTLPHLNEIATEIALKKAIIRKPGNSVKYFTFSNNQKNSNKIRDLIIRFYHDLEQLSAEDDGISENHASKKFVSVINAEINLEDLI